MPDIKMSSLPNRVLPIIFVVDTSGSMMGERIAEVHEGIRESIDLLREYQDTVPGLRIGVAVLAFDSSSKWIMDKITDVKDCSIEVLEASGATSFGRMLQALNEGLSRSSLFQDVDTCFAPAIIFITDGESTDEWEESLDKIENGNKWFINAVRLAVAIDDADIKCLRRIVGEKGAVVTVDKANVISSFLSNLSVSIAEIIGEERIDSLYTECKNTTAEEILKRTSGHLGYPINDVLDFIWGFDENRAGFSLDYSWTPAVVTGRYQ